MSNIPVDPLKQVAELNKILEENTYEDMNALIGRFRSEKVLLAELPSVFEAALESILERMESTALFSEESCSFSRSDMVAALTVWAEKAKSYLEKQAGLT